MMVIEERLRYILLKAYWEGEVSRSDLVKRFDISNPQATVDFRNVRNKYPHSIQFVNSERRYKPDHGLKKFVDSTTFNEYYELMNNAEDFSINIIPHQRVINNLVYQPIYQSIKAQTRCDIIYRSINNPDNDKTRTIFPHSLVNSGFRWHVRAYELQSKSFKDFNLSRIVKAVSCSDIPPPAGGSFKDDQLANQDITLILTPNLQFGEAQRKVIAMDYMSNGEMSVALIIKASLLLYVLHIYEIRDFSEYPPETQLLQIGNIDSLKDKLDML